MMDKDAEIARLKEDNARLREVLEPLALLADFYDHPPHTGNSVLISYGPPKNIFTLTVGDCRRARAALRGGE